MDLRNRTAIVTGAGAGIGQAIAVALASCGVKVLLCDRDSLGGERTAAHIAALGGQALSVHADLADKETPARIVHEAVNAWGAIHIVVNNAALTCNKPIADIGHADWDRLIEVNLKAPFFLVQAALPWLIQSKGAIVNISSTASINNIANNLIYDTLKAGINHMTRGLALGLRPHGIRVNALLPGGTATPNLEAWLDETLANDSRLPPDASSSRKAELLQAPHVASPQQIADAVLMLLSPQSNWINGAIIPVDGGYHLGGI